MLQITLAVMTFLAKRPPLHEKLMEIIGKLKGNRAFISGKRSYIPASEYWCSETGARTITIYLYYTISPMQNSAEPILQCFQKQPG